jgi:hypothetical protein
MPLPEEARLEVFGSVLEWRRAGSPAIPATYSARDWLAATPAPVLTRRGELAVVGGRG